MKRLSLLPVLLLIAFLATAQQENYSRIKIFLDHKTTRDLGKTGIEISQFNPKEGWAIAEIADREIRALKQAGFRYEVIQEDLERYYAERYRSSAHPGNEKSHSALSDEWPVPANFTLGTCGGFLTIDAMIDQLDLMRSLYPGLISVKQLVSDSLTTIEGRPMYYVKISDNPDLAENEPQVLYTGMHHAREPIGMQHLMYYMWYLLENYSTHQEVKDLVDNTEMYFIPIVNVDGYAYNITTNPLGGGMWRKNRRDNGGGNFGIDINRNYGYMWGYDDEGSSPDPSSDLYRGTGPFSEPETRMIKYFCESHNFKIALNYHSYSGLFLYSWGWSSFPTPDEDIFSAYASEITKENFYTYGAGYTTIYPTNGGSDDWMYGEQTSKPKILSYTPEVGNSGDGFWPDQNRIIPLCQENMLASFTAARLVGKYGRISDESPFFLWQESGYLSFSVKRLGMQEGDFTVSVTPLSDAITMVGSPVTISDLGLLSRKIDSIPYQLSSGLHAGDTLKYVLVLDNGLYPVYDTIIRVWGYPYPVFTDHFGNKNNWTGNWSLTTSSYYSPYTSMTDSPFGPYPSNANRSISLTNPISLTPSLLTILEFRSHWALETGFDYVQLKLSSNNGNTWIPLSGRYTRPGTIYQASGQPLYDGMESEWVRENISLNDWQEKNILLRFTLVSDGGTELDGFYYDDLVISNLLDPTSITEYPPKQSWLGNPTPLAGEEAYRINYLLPHHSNHPILNVYTMTGSKWSSREITQQEGFVDFQVKDWPSGIYIISLEDKGLPSQVRKMIVAR